jgi:hypothetical protein
MPPSSRVIWVSWHERNWSEVLDERVLWRRMESDLLGDFLGGDRAQACSSAPQAPRSARPTSSINRPSAGTPGNEVAKDLAALVGEHTGVRQRSQRSEMCGAIRMSEQAVAASFRLCRRWMAGMSPGLTVRIRYCAWGAAMASTVLTHLVVLPKAVAKPKR